MQTFKRAGKVGNDFIQDRLEAFPAGRLVEALGAAHRVPGHLAAQRVVLDEAQDRARHRVHVTARDDQAVLIAGMQTALEKLSRIHSSLTLLTKLENKEYTAGTPVCISVLARETLDTFEELIQMKSLTLSCHIEEKVYIPLHSSLADLLLTNLISNAIRHNIPGGSIKVMFARAGMVISNTGLQPQLPVAELFERFKKGDPASDSIGIGLAIVRQICDLMNFNIVYEYASGQHIIAISFQPSLSASKLLQNLSFPLYPVMQP